MTVAHPPPVSWWSTIFEPGWPAVVTAVTFLGFIVLGVIGGVFVDCRLWSHAPAVAGVLTWYVVMMRRYRRRRSP